VSQLAVGSSIEVESANPAIESPHEISPGVAAKKTACLLVGFDIEQPPVFSVSTGPLTASVRELGYGLVRVIDKAKGLPFLRRQTEGTYDSPGPVRRRYRAMRSYLASELVLPNYEPSTDPRLHWSGESPAFEASRQIIKFTEQQDSVQLICHVLAPRENETTSRLIGEFFEEFNSTKGESTLCDIESHICLVGRSSFRIGRRQYWEILVGPMEGLSDVDLDETLDSGNNDAQELLSTRGERRLINMTSRQAADERKNGVALLDSADTEEFNDRSRIDWDFMSHQIARAVEEGIDLDEEFVESLAVQRLEHARTVLAVETPGPTLESSRRIAREVVAIHRLALEKHGES
jgi:hypothetical protein